MVKENSEYGTINQVAGQFNLSYDTARKSPFFNQFKVKKKGLGVRFNLTAIYKTLNEEIPIPSDLPASTKLELLNAHDRMRAKGDVMAAKHKGRSRRGIGGVYARGKHFHIYYYDENRQRKREAVREAQTWEQAEQVLEKKLQQVFQKKYVLIGGDKEICFKDFAGEYIETHAQVNKKSWELDKKYLRKHLIPFFGDRLISEITVADVERYKAKKLGAELQKNSINRHLQLLRSMINIADNYGYRVGKNPVRGRLFSEKGFRRSRVLSAEEETKLLKEASPTLRPVIQFALLSGCRQQEVLGLQKSDIDFKNGTITIRPELNKTGSRDVIPIHPELERFIKGHLDMNGKSEYVFTYEDKTTKESRPFKDIQSMFRRARIKAGISNIQFRDLRRTTATRWHEKGVDPLVISRAVLRHKKFSTSEEFYIQSFMGHVKDVLEKASKLTQNRHKKK